MSTCLQNMIQLHLISVTIPSTGHFSKMLLVQWMAVISAVHPLHSNDQFVGTRKALCHKIAYFVATLIFNLSIPLLNGNVLPQMHKSMIYIFLLASIALLIQVIHYVQSSWYHIAMYIIILLNGVVHTPGQEFFKMQYS